MKPNPGPRCVRCGAWAQAAVVREGGGPAVHACAKCLAAIVVGGEVVNYHLSPARPDVFVAGKLPEKAVA